MDARMNVYGKDVLRGYFNGDLSMLMCLSQKSVELLNTWQI
jgi:hypothetical protein